jgi:hypothetical protein
MIDAFAKKYLHEELQSTRAALVWKLNGLSEYDVRRPLTATGPLLGLVKHMATLEARCLEEIFNRPFPGLLPRWQDSNGSDLWVTESEPRTDPRLLPSRLGSRRRDDPDTPLDARGHVPWWPRPDVNLFSVMVHVLNDTTRHAGHADIVREQLDGRTGVAAGQQEQIHDIAREAHCAMVE